MAIDTEHFKKLLVDKERDLLATISRLTAEGRDARDAEVEDPIDEVTSSEGRTAAFQASTIEMRTLQEVRDALRRIAEGTYGKCEDCGNPIEPARLEALPWARYCRVHQEKHDREADQDE